MEQTPHEHPKQHQTQVDAVSRNLEEWFAELEKKLSKKDIAYFKSLKEDEIVKCHHALGRWIRK
jgi:hypothetical protein